jgi:hypothetical protein
LCDQLEQPVRREKQGDAIDIALRRHGRPSDGYHAHTDCASESSHFAPDATKTDHTHGCAVQHAEMVSGSVLSEAARFASGCRFVHPAREVESSR